MKNIFIIAIGITSFFLTSCASVRVASDFDQEVNFTQYKTFSFLKEGIDRVEISDLDKKRILRNIEAELIKKGMILVETSPDILVNFFTKERERQDIYNNVGFGWGWGPFWGNSVIYNSTQTEGSLFIDIIRADKKDLIWQGKGVGILSPYDNKEERISQFVSEILKQYPPQIRRK